MNKTALTLSILAVISTASHAQQTQSTDEAQAPERILVTANRTQQDSFTALSSHQIIDSLEIAKLQTQSTSDLLKKVAGIYVANQGGAGQQSSVFTRGTNSNHTLVIVDGVRTGSATTGAANFESLAVSQIERIEVVKGPRAALWGSDAIGGVIQIFTKRYAAGKGNVTAGLGSNGLWSTAASVGFGNTNHQYTVNASAEASDGFDARNDAENDDDGYDKQSFSLVGQSTLSEKVALNVLAKLEQGGYDIDTSWGGNENEYDNYQAKIGTAYQATDNLFIEFDLSSSRDQSVAFGNGIAKKDAAEIETTRDQVSLLTHYNLAEKSSVSAGLDWYNEDVTASGIEEERDITAVYVQSNHQVNSFLFEGAIRNDDIDGIGNETTYNASVGHQMNSHFLISFSHGTGFKAPTFNDLYSPFGGNPDLTAEESTTNELLIRSLFDNFNVEVSAYDTDIDNLIVWNPDENGNWSPSNVNEANMQGVDITASYNTQNLSNALSIGYVETEDQATKKELLRRPELSVSYSLSYQIDELTLDSSVTYRDESKDFGDITLDAYTLVDLGAQYEVNDQLVVSAKVNNIFDEEYESAASYEADGTQYKVSLSYSF